MIAAVLVFLLLAPLALCQDVGLEVKGGKVVQVDRQVVVKVDVVLVPSAPFSVQAPNGAGLYFWTYPPGVTAQDRGDRLDITACPKGEQTVSVKLITADLDAEGKFKGFVTKFGTTTFIVGEAPDPKPPVPPDPKPVPVAGPFWLIVVEESAERTQATAKIIGDLGLQKELRLSGHTWRLYDKDDPAVTKNNYSSFVAEAGGLPMLLVLDKSGKKIRSTKLPDSADKIKALVKEVSGGK